MFSGQKPVVNRALCVKAKWSVSQMSQDEFKVIVQSEGIEVTAEDDIPEVTIGVDVLPSFKVDVTDQEIDLKVESHTAHFTFDKTPPS